ncbi:hypothetical protein [Nitrosomonas sp.]|uniref:hypothetical protein n=1 Tax=Nitrosomonas sp. TaxID=42353 RepID=UPI001D3A3AA1|nr:hypothetical protein [Nitrosomonas sp.]MBX3617491.1 hypothetical protein [Nitrosomonas sp.]
MVKYTMNIAKRDFMMGYLKQYRIIKAPELMLSGSWEKRWHISLGYGETHGYLVDSRTKEPRLFKTLDAAVKALEDVGFNIIALDSYLTN